MTQGDYVGVAELVVDNWYNQVSNYDFAHHDMTDPNGAKVSSFVQVIWKNSTLLGVGIALKRDSSEVIGKKLPKNSRKYLFFKLFADTSKRAISKATDLSKSGN